MYLYSLRSPPRAFFSSGWTVLFLNLSLYKRCSCRLIILVAFCWTLSCMFMSLLYSGAQNWALYSRCGLTSAEKRERITPINPTEIQCQIQAIILLAFFVAVWDRILRQLPQNLFAKLAAGPLGRPAKTCLPPSLLQNPLAGQPNINQTRMCLDPDPLPDLLEPGLRKNHMHRIGGTWGTCHCLGSSLPEHLINGRVIKRPRDPHHRCTQELLTDWMTLDPWWWLSLETLSRLLAKFLSLLSFLLFPFAVSLRLCLNKWSINLFHWQHLISFVS